MTENISDAIDFHAAKVSVERLREENHKLQKTLDEDFISPIYLVIVGVLMFGCFTIGYFARDIAEVITKWNI